MPTQYSKQDSFTQPWPVVLVEIEAWIRLQAIQAGEMQQPVLEIRYSREDLRRAKAQGVSIQPAYGRFCEKLLRDWQITVARPEPGKSLHDGPDHLVTFHYWK
ncbi:MAG: hypothetical protein V4864_21895 [Pseudomonadota bacterium]